MPRGRDRGCGGSDRRGCDSETRAALSRSAISSAVEACGDSRMCSGRTVAAMPAAFRAAPTCSGGMLGQRERQDPGPPLAWRTRSARPATAARLRAPRPAPRCARRSTSTPASSTNSSAAANAPGGHGAQVRDRPRRRGAVRRVDLVVEQTGVARAGPARQHRVHPFQRPVRQHGEPGPPPGAQPLLPADDQDVGHLPRCLDHAEALDAVDHQQSVADDLAQERPGRRGSRCGSRRR